jgi:benzoyl-CoA reductase/2-hydroxyglutaryl-CoA dehydratase subunit BcrC/BadD/HgdB
MLQYLNYLGIHGYQWLSSYGVSNEFEEEDAILSAMDIDEKSKAIIQVRNVYNFHTLQLNIFDQSWHVDALFFINEQAKNVQIRELQELLRTSVNKRTLTRLVHTGIKRRTRKNRWSASEKSTLAWTEEKTKFPYAF